MKEVHSRTKANSRALKQSSFWLGSCEGAFLTFEGSQVVQTAEGGCAGSILGGFQDLPGKEP